MCADEARAPGRGRSGRSHVIYGLATLATPSTAVQVWFVCEIWTLTDSALDPLQGGAGPRSRAPRSPAAASGRSVSSRPRRDAARARARRACPLGVSGDAGPKEMRHASDATHTALRERGRSHRYDVRAPLTRGRRERPRQTEPKQVLLRGLRHAYRRTAQRPDGGMRVLETPNRGKPPRRRLFVEYVGPCELREGRRAVSFEILSSAFYTAAMSISAL